MNVNEAYGAWASTVKGEPNAKECFLAGYKAAMQNDSNSLTEGYINSGPARVTKDEINEGDEEAEEAAYQDLVDDEADAEPEPEVESDEPAPKKKAPVKKSKTKTTAKPKKK